MKRNAVLIEPQPRRAWWKPESLIVPPPRCNAAGTALVLAITVLVSIAPLVHGKALVAIGVGIVLTTAVAAWRGSWQALSLGIFWTVVAASTLSGVYYQQVTLGVSVVAYTAIVWVVLPLRSTIGWARRGRFSRDVQLLIVAAVATSSTALVIWYQLTQPDLSDLVRNFVPNVAPALLIVGAVVFAMVNAILEEVAYRGVLMHALDSALGIGVGSVAVQAIPFGILHLSRGFPRGWIGVGLATIYGVMMGLVRRRAQGMLAPWVAHVFADLSIGAIVLTVAP